MRKPTMWFLTRSDTRRVVQAQRMARGWTDVESRRIVKGVKKVHSALHDFEAFYSQKFMK